MTESPSPPAGRWFDALAELRQATVAVSYATLVRQAAAQQPPIQISSQRLSDWFGGKSVPADPAAVRFLVEYLQPRVARSAGYQSHPLSWWLNLHQHAVRQRQGNRDDDGPGVEVPQPRRRLGRPVSACDPLVLEVHPAIHMPGPGSASVLPDYVPRLHDERLRETVERIFEDGRSRLVTLVGGSSTGKTRACWELAQYLEQRQPGGWWLWHPYDLTRPEAISAALDRVGPATIVWLNEAQHYLAPADMELGERVAAGLRTLLQHPARAPVLVLATLWPQYWDTLTFRPNPGVPDPHAQVRALLAGSMIDVADGFTPEQVARLQATGVDPRVRQAAAHAEGGRITQYLAGAPDLMDRYRAAPPAARAIIHVAIDARRLGHPPALPHALLERAAPGYLDDHDWDHLGDDWLQQALAYTARPCKGARGPLTRVRTRPGDPTTGQGQPRYRLADYLEQAGRQERSGVYPPESLWTALAATLTDPTLLHELGKQAYRRGRYQHAIWLYTRAAALGNTEALGDILRIRAQAGDPAAVEALDRQAAERRNTTATHLLGLWRGRADELRLLAEQRERTGDIAGAEAAAIQAADHGDNGALYGLARMREQGGDTAAAETLYLQAADRGDALALQDVARLREQAGDPAGAEAAAIRALDVGNNIFVLRALAQQRERAGDTPGAEAAYRTAADHGDSAALCFLAELRERAGDTAGAEALYRQAADSNDSEALHILARRREQAGDTTGAEAVLAQAASHAKTYPMQLLAKERERTGDAACAETLYHQLADHGDATALAALARLREQAGDTTAHDRIIRFGLTADGTPATSLHW